MKNGVSDDMTNLESSNGKACPFCDIHTTQGSILETPSTFAIYDKFPVSRGHALVIPKRHCQDYFSLSDEEQIDCWHLLNQLKMILDQLWHPDGYNIGINNFESAGQTIPHVHIHIIPRFFGDVNRPLGGIRGVIPEKKEY
jgi:diadenosine tetraphosphate (Ap4A) HIT family hydrolase